MTKKKKILTALTVIAVLVVLAATGWLAAYYFYRPDYLESDTFFDVSEVAYGEEITVMSYNVFPPSIAAKKAGSTVPTSLRKRSLAPLPT